MKKHLIYWLAAIVVLATGCQKELSFEGSNSPAKGSLQSDITGDCLPKTVNGIYVAASALVPATNSITVSVNVTKTGSYLVYTDTINGYFFRGTGTFTTLGATNVTLRGNGTPFRAQIDNFVVTFDTTYCDIQVTVLPAGSGPAVFTLAGAPGSCSSANVAGAYAVGVPLGASNTVTLNVNVMTAGTYNVTTAPAVGGMIFSGTGSLATGLQTITLIGTPTSIPTTTGANTIPVTAGGTTCSFVVNVGSPAAGTVNCTGATPAGTYIVNTALIPATNTVQIQVNVTTAGAYNITTDTVHGIWFNASGNFPTAPTTTTITLAGHGTPDAAGTWTYTVRFGTSTCTFTVTVNPALSNDYFPRTINSNWSYEWDDNPLDSLLRVVIPNTITALGNVFNIFMPDDGGGLDSTGFYSAGYYRRASGDYFEWFDYGTAFQYDNPAWTQYIMLKDNVAATTNWKTNGFAGTILGNPFNLRFSFTIPMGQKDVPITITTSTGTVTYQNVIVVQQKYEWEITPGVWQDLTSSLDFYTKSYYARGIGLIKYEELDAANNVTAFQELRRYQVF